ncbi:MAG: ABC transporter permease [Candidatus Marinimicrobia bacterium]|nr:ABC transporter permease [Candidatus Neomarinimicrobiota bacterium]MCF7851009.1 ABC transporter permease [Candidatus Neomarinimicrobiota bacterium]MCF7904937.1 ABC transporter permease [Candidatus Neomarinimicrobiota bacterium]
MNLRYIIREGFTGINRAKMPFMNAVFSVTIALVLVGSGVLFVDNGLSYIGNLQSDYDLEIFLSDDSSIEQKQELGMIITEYPGIIRMDYLSKDDAARIFTEEFGEDVLALLDDNPLPSSFRVTFEESYRTADYIQAFSMAMSALDPVDDVKFQKDFFDKVHGIMNSIYFIAAGTIFLIILSTVFLTASNLRMMILGQYESIRTTRLIGASDFLVKAPFFLEGAILGFIGSVFAVLIIAGIELSIVRSQFFDLPVRIHEYPQVILGLFIFGVSLSSLGVLKAVRRMLRFVS